MKHWPAHIQMRLTEEICIGRKSAVVRTLADRGERECPKGLEPGHFGAEIDERKVKHWKRMQTRYSSHKVIHCTCYRHHCLSILWNLWSHCLTNRCWV